MNLKISKTYDLYSKEDYIEYIKNASNGGKDLLEGSLYVMIDEWNRLHIYNEIEFQSLKIDFNSIKLTLIFTEYFEVLRIINSNLMYDKSIFYDFIFNKIKGLINKTKSITPYKPILHYNVRSRNPLLIKND